MKTFEILIQYIKNNKWKSFLYTLIVLLPLILYFFKFNDGLSSNETAWSTFGSYIGGVYAPIFTLASVIVLVATLFEISDSNRKTLEHAQSSNIISEIIELTRILDTSIGRKDLFKDRNYGFNWLAEPIKTRFFYDTPTNEESVWNACRKRFKEDDIEFFREQADIIYEIALRINAIENKEISNRAKSIFKAIIPNTERFWIECYINQHHAGAYKLISEWSHFSVLPHTLFRLIEQPEDVNP